MPPAQFPSDPDDEGTATPHEATPGWTAGPPPAADSDWPTAAAGWSTPPPPPPDDGYVLPPPSGGPSGQAPGYPPPGYPPPGYQAVGYPPPVQTDSKAIIGLILAISAWVVCPILPAVVALVLAGQSNRAIDLSGGRLEGRSLNTATKVISWLNLGLAILAILVLVVVIVIGIASGPTSFSDGSTQF